MSQRRSQDLLKDGVETGSLNFASPFAEQASASLDPALDRVCGEALSQLAAGERARLLSDGILNSGPFVASGVVGIILVPILLHGLGAELYGLWIYASSAAAVVGLADPGLGWSLTREVARAEARCRNETGDDAAARLVNNIAIVYLILGSSGALLISVLGLILVPGLHLSPSNSETAALVFCLIGASFLGDTMNDFGAGVLHGLRRFDITSAIAIVDTLITDGGIIALILAGKRLEYVAAWCALISLGTALVSIGLGAYVAPRYGIRPIRFSWQTISPHIEFGIKSQFASGMHQAGWSFMPLVVGIFTGPAMVAIYDVGQKFPSFLRATGGFLSQTIFPSASSCTDENQRKLGQGIVETGLRDVFLITTPLFLSVGILAPSLLNIWLGKVSTEAVWVLRLTLLAAWLDCVGGSPLHFLWGSGALDGILAVLGAGAIVNLGLSILLITKLGVAGAALATVIVSGAICVTLLGMGARAVGAEWSAMLRRAWKGLGIPTAVCTAVVVSTHYMAGANRAGEFILLCGVAASAYAVAVLARGLREEEWVVFGQLVAAPSRKLMSRFYRGLRRIGFPWAEWQSALVEMVADSPGRQSAGFDRTFDSEEDPYGFVLSYGRARHSRICEMLDSVRGARKFTRALEVGCAEGLFLLLLAQRCDSILATDVSAIALRRARERCRSLSHIEFALWNVRRDPMTIKFDLIVAMDVLYYLTRRWDLRKAARLLVDALLPGGYLLVENDKEHYPYEGRWWADYLLHSARAIDSLFVSDPSLEVVLTEENERYICTVLRKI